MNDKQKMYKWLKKHTRTGHVGSMTKEDIYDLLGKLRVVYEN